MGYQFISQNSVRIHSFFYKHQVHSAQPQICLNLNNRPFVFQPTSEPQYAYSLHAYKKKKVYDKKKMRKEIFEFRISCVKYHIRNRVSV